MSQGTSSGRNSRHSRRPWRTVGVLLLTLLAGVAALLIPVSAAQAATPVTFTTGAARTDTSGNALQLHGMGIIKVGDTWYGFGENKTGVTSSDTSFQAIACYSSTDLANWTYRGDALSLRSSGDLGPSRVVERPKVIYNAATQKYVMYVHIDSLTYSEAKVGVATSSTPCGAYDYRGSSRPLGQLSRDIGLFQDTDGTAYLLSEDRNNGLRIDLLSSDYLTPVSTVAILGSGGGANSFESPAMVKANGIYYLLASHLTGWSLNDNVYSTATSVSGTWSAMRNFAAPGTRTYGSQTANIITVAGTSGTTYIYAGDRWNPSDLGASQLIWLPLTISGTTVNLGQYPTWSLDVPAGTWTPNSGVPSAAAHTLTNSAAPCCSTSPARPPPPTPTSSRRPARAGRTSGGPSPRSRPTSTRCGTSTAGCAWTSPASRPPRTASSSSGPATAAPTSSSSSTWSAATPAASTCWWPCTAG